MAKYRGLVVITLGYRLSAQVLSADVERESPANLTQVMKALVMLSFSPCQLVLLARFSPSTSLSPLNRFCFHRSF